MMSIEKEGVMIVAKLMAVSARTAPKAKGSDTLVVRIASDDELNALAESMVEFGEKHGFGFFIRDAGNIRESDCCVIIGEKGDSSLGLNCGGCGHPTCGKMREAQKENKNDSAFFGPNCVMRQADLGIAIGSAVKTASLHNVDNRVMFSAGVGALKLGWLGDCNVAYGIPLSASGKSIFFDRK